MSKQQTLEVYFIHYTFISRYILNEDTQLVAKWLYIQSDKEANWACQLPFPKIQTRTLIISFSLKK